MKKVLLWCVVLAVSGSSLFAAPMVSTTRPNDVLSTSDLAPLFNSTHPMATPELGSAEVFYSLPLNGIRVLLRQENSSDFQLTSDERRALLQRVIEIPVAHLKGLLAIEVKPYDSAQDPSTLSSIADENGQSKIIFYVDRLEVRQPPFRRNGHHPYPVSQEFTIQIAHHVYTHLLTDEQRKTWNAIDVGYPYRESAFVDRYTQWTNRSEDAFASFDDDADSLGEILFMAGLFTDRAGHRLQWYQTPKPPIIKPEHLERGLLVLGANRFRLQGSMIVGMEVNGGKEFTPASSITLLKAVLDRFGLAIPRTELDS